ncbi:MAG: hypothetical protein DHS20C19_22800 [Acidimicrobiales bacterium]|nr:MAG: hypothetical protein DHS20C19_22800 [Acidimicrobiales bacterium]
MTVPVQHEDPSGPTYDLAVTRLHAATDTPGPPVVYLSGGPGYPGGDPDVWGNSTMLAERDVIVYDQRGTGSSTPNMQCPELEQAVFDILGAAAPFADELVSRNAQVEACHARLLGEGIDLNSFSTPHSAADLDLIRQALEIDRWHLFGVSYGTRLALETMRSFPGGVETAILDSVYPTTAGEADRMRSSASRVFAAFVETCAITTCDADHPDLGTQLDLATSRYDDEPIELTVAFDGVDHDFALTGPDVAAGLFNALYDTELIPLLPTITESFASGDTGLASELVDRGVSFLNSAAEGMAMATECADNGNLAEAADWDEEFADPDIYATLLLVAPVSMCPWFPVEPVDPAFNEPVSTLGPALVLAGSLDPITPPGGSMDAAGYIGAVYPLTWEQIGHGVVFADPCAATLAEAWLRDSGTAKNEECVSDRDDRAPWQPVDGSS